MGRRMMGSLGRFLALACVLAIATPTIAGQCSTCTSSSDCCSSVGSECGPCGVTTKVVRRPQWVTEMKTVTVTEYHKEEREKTYTVSKMVPHTETKTREVEYTEWVEEAREKVYTVCETVKEEHEVEYEVMVPHKVTKKGTRTVMTKVTEPVEKTYTVMVPHEEVKQGRS